MVEILDLLLFKGNTPERTCPINTGDQPANEQHKPSVGNHFFQTLSKMASGLKQVLAKMK
jgi:hypothetical protein